MNVYSVRSDTEKNRLYITLEGFFNIEQAQEVAKIVMVEIDKLKPKLC
jgi:hypothetical protein